MTAHTHGCMVALTPPEHLLPLRPAVLHGDCNGVGESVAGVVAIASLPLDLQARVAGTSQPREVVAAMSRAQEVIMQSAIVCDALLLWFVHAGDDPMALTLHSLFGLCHQVRRLVQSMPQMLPPSCLTETSAGANNRHTLYLNVFVSSDLRFVCFECVTQMWMPQFSCHPLCMHPSPSCVDSLAFRQRLPHSLLMPMAWPCSRWAASQLVAAHPAA